MDIKIKTLTIVLEVRSRISGRVAQVGGTPLIPTNVQFFILYPRPRAQGTTTAKVQTNDMHETINITIEKAILSCCISEALGMILQSLPRDLLFTPKWC